MQGVILSAGTAQGLILGDDGARYTFTPLGWRDDGASPQPGMRVDFEVRGSHAVGIYPVPGGAPAPSSAPGVPPDLPSHPATTPSHFPPARPGAAPPAGPPSMQGPHPDQPSPPPPAKRGFGREWWHWALAGGAAFAVVGVVGAVLLGIFSTSAPPVGVEIARHTHEGRTYALVEYEDELAIFSETGSPVVRRELAEDVLRSYAWRQIVEGLDVEELEDVSEKARLLDDGISDARSLSNDVVAIFDGLDGMKANIPLVGSISAMDVVRDSFPGVGDAEDLIRSLDAELNALEENVATLTRTTKRLRGVEPSSVSGEEMASLFAETLGEARDLEASVQEMRDFVSEARELVEGLANALRAGSDTPIIGGALGDFAGSAGRFESELSGLASQLGGFKSELAALGDDIRDAQDLADKTLNADVARWLAEPYDAEWPPSGEEGPSAQDETQAEAGGQGAEPATFALRDDGSGTGGEPVDYQKVYQAAYDEAYSKKYNEVIGEAHERFGESFTERQRRNIERNANRIAERHASKWATVYAEIFVVTGSDGDAYRFANRVMAGQLEDYSIQLDAGKSPRYAAAYALQIDHSNSEEYAAAYAQHIEGGNSEEDAAAYAQQIEDGNATVAPQSFDLEWETSATRVEVGESFTLTVRMYGVKEARERGGISVSFPSLTQSAGPRERHSSSVAEVEALDYTSGLENVTFLQPGATIYHRENNRQFAAEYLLVESDDASWSSSDDRTLVLRITPSRGGEFRVQIRAWVCADGYTDCARNPDGGNATDQQGWVVEVATISVSAAVERRSSAFTDDFDGTFDSDRWLLYGSAEHLGADGVVRLTAARESQLGILLHRQPVRTEGFGMEFSFEIGGGSGADGLGLVLLRSMPDFDLFDPLVDYGGHWLSRHWLSRHLEGFVVAFDTHRNESGYRRAGGRELFSPVDDPSSNFVALSELGAGL